MEISFHEFKKKLRELLIYSIENKLRSIPNLFGATLLYYSFFAVFCKKTCKACVKRTQGSACEKF